MANRFVALKFRDLGLSVCLFQNWGSGLRVQELKVQEFRVVV